MTADVVLDAYYRTTGKIPRGSDHQRSGICPAHDDRKASFSIRLADDRILLNCHAGCTFDEILAALGITKADTYNQPLPDSERRSTKAADEWMPCVRDGHHRIAEYLYTDEQGTVEHGVCRCNEKCFRQWRPDSTKKSGRRWSLNDDQGNRAVRFLPYRLPQILAAITVEKVVWIAEGEKDVHALVGRGLEATCNAGGVGMGWLPEHARHLQGADVTIVADRDEAGRRHAESVVETLRGIARSVYVVQSRHGKDAFDHYAGGGTTGDFIEVWAPIPFGSDIEVNA